MSNVIAARTELRIQNWKKLIAAQAESGLTVREFCRQQDLSTHSYYYWLRKIRMQVIEDKTPSATSSQQIQFSRLTQTIQIAQPLQTSKINISYGDFNISADASTSPEALRNFLAVIKELES